MKKLRKAIGVIESAYENCSITDQKYINMLALTSPLSAVVAGVAFYTFVQFFSQSTIISMIVGGITFLAFYWHGQSLLSTENLNQIFGRIASSLLIILFVFVPFKADQIYDEIVSKIQQEVDAMNAEVYMEINAEIEEIEREGERMNQVMIETANRRHIDKQPWYEARRALEAFNNSKQGRIEEIKKAYEKKIITPEISRFDVLGYYAKNMFSTENPTELFINLALIVFLLFIEASPAVLRLAIENGDYLEKRDHIFDLKRIADSKIMGLERQIMTNDKNVVMDVFHIEILKEKKKLIQSGFDDPKEIIKLIQTVEMMEREIKEKMQNSEKNGSDGFSQNGQYVPEEDGSELPEFLS